MSIECKRWTWREARNFQRRAKRVEVCFASNTKSWTDGVEQAFRQHAEAFPEAAQA